MNADDALAVLDATDTDAAFLVALCSGIKWSLLAADRAPGRVRGIVAIGPGVHPLAPQPDPIQPVDDPRWAGNWEGWVDYHSDLLLPEPHSTKAFEDMVGWSLQTDSATITARTHASLRPSAEQEAVDLVLRLGLPCSSSTAPRTAASRSSAAAGSRSSPGRGSSSSRVAATSPTPGTRCS